MDRLANVPELLDGPLDDEAALAGNLRDLARFNRWLAGFALSRAMLDRLVDRDDVALLDVGTGGADIPARLVRDWRKRGRRIVVTAVDDRPEVLAVARTRNLPDGVHLELADGRRLPFPDAAFDVAHASLLHHHLSADEAVACLAEMARVARLGIVVNDLARSRLGWVGAWGLTRTLTRNAFTRNDAPLSVRRAWTRPEMVELLARAGLRPVAQAVGPFRHRYAIAAVRR